MIALLFAITLLRAHPIHTTVLELRWNASTATLEGTLRVFEEDLRAAALAAHLTPMDYVLRSVGVESGGRAAGLVNCGERRAADAVLVCLRATVKDLRGIRVRNDILLDRYADQVNIVRLERGGTTTILLTRAAPERIID